MAVLTVVFFVFTASAFADDAVITGKVGAPGNEDVDGAIVKLLGVSDQLIEETQVNSSGDYEFENVPYGDYQMYASLEGFEDSNTHKVKVNRPVVNVNLQLRPGDSDDDDDSDRISRIRLLIDLILQLLLGRISLNDLLSSN